MNYFLKRQVASHQRCLSCLSVLAPFFFSRFIIRSTRWLLLHFVHHWADYKITTYGCKCQWRLPIEINPSWRCKFGVPGIACERWGFFSHSVKYLNAFIYLFTYFKLTSDVCCCCCLLHSTGGSGVSKLGNCVVLRAGRRATIDRNSTEKNTIEKKTCIIMNKQDFFLG